MTRLSDRAGGAVPLRTDFAAPLWLQAAEGIRERIASGELPAGSRLPPERELCQSLGISRVTLRKSIARLVDEGVLRPALGRGWAIATGDQKEWPNNLESFTETAARMGLQPSSTVLDCRTVLATIDDAELLQIAPGTPTHRIERVRKLDGIPIGLDIALVPAEYAPQLPETDFQHASLYGALAAAGVELVNAETTIEAREASAGLARHLNVEAGSPTLVMFQLVRNRAGRPVLASTIKYASDRYRLRTTFSRT